MFRLFRQLSNYTMLSLARLKRLYRLTQELDRRGLAGPIVECGVYHGGSAAVMAYASRHAPTRRPLWLFDSFQGLPEPTPEDGHKARNEYHPGWCRGDVAKVKEVFQRLGIPLSQVHIVEGWYQETFPRVRVASVSLLHIDADWYDSVKLCLDKFYDAVEPGGFVVLDDYGYWEGCRRAVDEFFRLRGLQMKLIPIDSSGRYFEKAAPR